MWNYWIFVHSRWNRVSSFQRNEEFVEIIPSANQCCRQESNPRFHGLVALLHTTSAPLAGAASVAPSLSSLPVTSLSLPLSIYLSIYIFPSPTLCFSPDHFLPSLPIPLPPLSLSLIFLYHSLSLPLSLFLSLTTPLSSFPLYLCFSIYPFLPSSEKAKTQFEWCKCFFVASLGEDPIREWILTEGNATRITRISPIGGGCINHANRYDTDNDSFFVKTNRKIGPSMFEGETIGLNAMYNTKSIRVPRPFKFGTLPTGGSFIIMEFIEFGSSRGNQSSLGRRLAEMHKAGKSDEGFGFLVDNTIGSTPQINSWSSDWIEFFSEHRLGYQLKLALKQFGDSDIYEKGQLLIKNVRPLFEGAIIEPCLLHGDLWSGNISSDKNGNPVILDPACYYGHNEAEFGMSWCAGFGESFYSSYFEVMPEQPGFENRRELYMLYHYLNHYNLFGYGYRSSAMSIIDSYLRILST